MSPAAVGHCDKCAAVVNLHWRSCLVCHAELSTVPTHPQIETGIIRPGSLVSWTRAGIAKEGFVDCIYVDDTGVRWAFVSFGKDWAAVNLRHVTMRNDVAPLSTIVAKPPEGKV